MTDLQAILLTHAAQRDSDNLLPMPAVVSDSAVKVPAAITSLIKRRLAQHHETHDPAATYCTVGELLRFAAVITSAGLAVINIAVDENVAPEQVIADLRGQREHVCRQSRRQQGFRLIWHLLLRLVQQAGQGLQHVLVGRYEQVCRGHGKDRTSHGAHHDDR